MIIFHHLLVDFSDVDVVIRLRGQNLTLPYLHGTGFSQPILIEGKDGLGLAVPQENFTVQDIENYVGVLKNYQ